MLAAHRLIGATATSIEAPAMARPAVAAILSWGPPRCFAQYTVQASV